MTIRRKYGESHVSKKVGPMHEDAIKLALEKTPGPKQNKKRKYNWNPMHGAGTWPEDYDAYGHVTEDYRVYLSDGVWMDARFIEGDAWVCGKCAEHPVHGHDALVWAEYSRCCHCNSHRKDFEETNED